MLPEHVQDLTTKNITDLFHEIDRYFWGSGVQRSATKNGWTIRFNVDQAHISVGTLRKTTPSIGSVSVRQSQKDILLTIKSHKTYYYPTYPQRVYGVLVHDWLEHLCHTIGNEMVHMAVIMLIPGTARVYDALFEWLNQWVYGHIPVTKKEA